jgi:predicted TIM-barrel fold metal-dependent hydrolase
MPTAPDNAGSRFTVPQDACDCHMHVFGAPERYSVPELRSYTPQEASLASWRRAAGAVGLQRVVVVQPSVYGEDNSCTLDALREIGPQGRGIAQIGRATSDTQLADLHRAGVRGIRLNPKSVGANDTQALRSLIANAARRIAPLGWHIQIYASLTMVTAVADAIREAPVPVVLDHMGGARAGDGEAALRTLIELLSDGRCWVKLSGAYRVSHQGMGFHDSTPIARALVRANPEQIVWGTDWPHTGHHAGVPRTDAPPIGFRTLDLTELLDRLADAAGDQATFARILVANPGRLYRFRSRGTTNTS